MTHKASKNTLQDALVQELQELLSLEKAFMMALPMMAQSAINPQLRAEFERLHGQTREQIARLGRLVPPSSAQGTPPVDFTQTVASPSVRDALLVASVRRIQHEKIAGYSTVQTWAGALNLTEVEQAIAQNLQQDEQTCEKLRHMKLGRNKA